MENPNASTLSPAREDSLEEDDGDKHDYREVLAEDHTFAEKSPSPASISPKSPENDHLNSRIQMYQERDLKHSKEMQRLEDRLARAEEKNQGSR